MAMLKRDSFDNYTTVSQRNAVLNGTTSPDIGAYGRHGTNGLRIRHGGGGGTYVQKTIPATTTIIAGVAFSPATMHPSTSIPILGFYDASSAQVIIYLGVDGTIIVTRGTSTVLATSSNSLMAGNYYYVEAKVKIDSTTGTVEVRVNGSVTGWINISGQNTQATANNTATVIRLGHNTVTTSLVFQYDDLVIMDTTGAQNNNFLGDVRVECLFPNAAGTYSDWTALGGGADYLEVDETVPDDDTSYVSSSTVNQKDTFNAPSLATTAGSVFDVAVIVRHEKSGAGDRTIRALIISDPTGTPTESEGGDLPEGSSYVTEESGFALDPDTGVAWTIAGVNAAEFGVKLQA